MLGGKSARQFEQLERRIGAQRVIPVRWPAYEFSIGLLKNTATGKAEAGIQIEFLHELLIVGGPKRNIGIEIGDKLIIESLQTLAYEINGMHLRGKIARVLF